ncbi:MAG: ribonuclease III [Patescibacteria group bacterium]|jgi:ribonuclease-3|nr:ribonuclease III [Patescibacteria group bacterium]
MVFNKEQVEAIIKVKFKSDDLIKTAFTHRSYVNEHRSTVKHHNERLEFLGDAVLELVVTDFLFLKFLDKPEGELTSWRAALVKTESLADLAETLDIGKFLLMSRGEAKSGGRTRMALLANLVEAIIGAIYLDQGYDEAAKFIDVNINSKLDGILASGAHIDAKSHFQEISQEREGTTPHYEVVSESGPDHDKIFEMAVYLKDKIWGTGKGNSKQTAQQSAAQDALEKYEVKKSA